MCDVWQNRNELISAKPIHMTLSEHRFQRLFGLHNEFITGVMSLLVIYFL